jgi:hypothetical protein
MKLLGILLTACVVLAAARAVTGALAVILLLAIVCCVFAYPRETCGCLTVLLLAALIQRYPLPCLSIAAITIVAKLSQRT